MQPAISAIRRTQLSRDTARHAPTHTTQFTAAIVGGDVQGGGGGAALGHGGWRGLPGVLHCASATTAWGLIFLQRKRYIMVLKAIRCV